MCATARCGRGLTDRCVAPPTARPRCLRRSRTRTMIDGSAGPRPHDLPVREEADPGVSADTAALGRSLPVAAGDPQARTGEQHVIRVGLGHGVARRAGRIQLYLPATRRQALQALVGYRTGGPCDCRHSRSVTTAGARRRRRRCRRRPRNTASHSPCRESVLSALRNRHLSSSRALRARAASCSAIGPRSRTW